MGSATTSAIDTYQQTWKLRGDDHCSPEYESGYQLLLHSLQEWGVNICAGVTGGGIIHFLKHIPPYIDQKKASERPLSFLSIGEYVAGYIPLGYFIATGSVACSVATTGAATKLLACGLSDAKLHDIPSVYMIPVSDPKTKGYCPLQDTSSYGSNIVAQLSAELPEAVLMLDDPRVIGERLLKAHELLANSKPVVLVLVHEALSQIPTLSQPLPQAITVVDHENTIREFIDVFRQHVQRRRVVVLVGEELARYTDAPRLTTQLCQALGAPAVWSINGANSIERANPYGYGYISFGGNDKALELWNSLCEDDVLLAIGVCPDEYTLNFKRIAAGSTFFLTNIKSAYGQVDGSFRHWTHNYYYYAHAPLDKILRLLIKEIETIPPKNRRALPAPPNLNSGPLDKAATGFVDLAKMYQMLDKWWKPNSIGIDDVCLAYKDRQYITQRPNQNIKFYALYRGSAMGGTLGIGIGAKLASPESDVYIFTGDGCFRLFAGCLGEARNLGIVIFVLNNQQYSIVEQGLGEIIPDVASDRYHSLLFKLDFCSIARACGWDSYSLADDLSNLYDILESCQKNPQRSALIGVPVDGRQMLGKNPRVKNL